MVDEIVIIHDGEPRVSTSEIHEDLGYKEHRHLKRLINQNKERFLQLGLLPFQRQKPTNKKGGRPDESFLLNEPQFTALIFICKNNTKSLDLKFEIARQFDLMKKALIEIKERQISPDWKQVRQSGKVTRKESTDIIQDFIEYAKSQGSKNADNYFRNFTSMENKALFIITQKFKNVRDVLDGQQLMVIGTCDQIVLKAIKAGMEEGMFYKDIFQEAKKEVLKFVDIIGQSYVPNQKQINE